MLTVLGRYRTLSAGSRSLLPAAEFVRRLEELSLNPRGRTIDSTLGSAALGPDTESLTLSLSQCLCLSPAAT